MKNLAVLSLFAALALGGSSFAQQSPALSYLGPQGTYSDAVAQAAAADLKLTPTLAGSITEVSNQVSAGAMPYGLIPIRNSSGGYVIETQGLLARVPAWRIVGVYQLAINNVLMAKTGTTLKDVKTIVSHPQPFLQSAGYLKANFPEFKKVEVKSTAAAAEQVAKDGDKTTAAIAAPSAAKLYGLEVLGNAIQDDKLNTTRFLVVQQGEIADSVTGTHAEISFLAGPIRGNADSRQVTDALSRLGLGIDGMLSSPTGQIDSERLTIFASGSSVDAATLRKALADSGATLIGLHGAPKNVGTAASSNALTQACPTYDALQPAGTRLAQLAVCRLDVALLVAQSKYASGAAVEDLAREQVVIDAAVAANPQMPKATVEAIWRGQIEASKIAQRALISNWTTAVTPKLNPAPDLTTQVRLLLDVIGAQMQQDLAEAWATRSCAASVSNGTLSSQPSDYAAARGAALDPLKSLCNR